LLGGSKLPKSLTEEEVKDLSTCCKNMEGVRKAIEGGGQQIFWGEDPNGVLERGGGKNLIGKGLLARIYVLETMNFEPVRKS